MLWTASGSACNNQKWVSSTDLDYCSNCSLQLWLSAGVILERACQAPELDAV